MATVKMLLSDATLSSVPEQIKRINDTKLSGFHARIGQVADGKKPKIALYLNYRIGGVKGKQRNYHLGYYGERDLKEVRKDVESLKGRIAAGEDVYDTKKTAIQQQMLEDTSADVATLAGEFMVRYVNAHRKRPEIVQAMLDKDILPTIGTVKLHHLDKRLVTSKTLDPILDRGSPVQANKTLSLLKQMFDFGIDRALCKATPLHR